MSRAVCIAIFLAVLLIVIVGKYYDLTYQPPSPEELQRRAVKDREENNRLAEALCKHEVGMDRAMQQGFEPSGAQLHDYAMCMFKRAY
jgi:hypothetical protein